MHAKEAITKIKASVPDAEFYSWDYGRSLAVFPIGKLTPDRALIVCQCSRTETGQETIEATPERIDEIIKLLCPWRVTSE